MKKYIRISVIIILLFSLSACGFGRKEKQIDNSEAEKIKNIIKMEKEYKSAASAILKPYFQSQEFSGIKNEILELKVPSEYLDLHFNLVVAFELLEQGRAESDQSKIENGLEKINKLKEEYPWLE